MCIFANGKSLDLIIFFFISVQRIWILLGKGDLLNGKESRFDIHNKETIEDLHITTRKSILSYIVK